MSKVFKKNEKKIMIFAAIIIALILLLSLSIPKIKEQIELNKQLTDFDAPREETEQIKLNEEYGENIYYVLGFDKATDVYNVENAQKIEEQYENIKDNLKYNLENPLLVHNLYGTNKLGLNIYFKSNKKSYLEYTISIEDEDVPDFTRILKNEGRKNLTKEHEYQIIGFVPGYINTLELELKNRWGKVIGTNEIKIDLTDIKTYSQTFADIKDGESEESLENGLYTILGNDAKANDYMSMYDNDGVLRSEVLIKSYRSHEMLFDGNSVYFSISNHQMVKMSNFGEVEEIYEMGDYLLHHDYDFDKDGNILILGTSLKKFVEEDVIIKLDLETKEVTEVIDFEDVFESYVDTCVNSITSQIDGESDAMDWLHLNSIDYVDGDVYLSGREVSSILKVSNIDTDPKLEYIISAEEIWKDTEFEKYVYEKVGDFKIQAGQHSVNYIEGDKEGVYYLELFDNNYGKATSQPNFDYEDIGIKNHNPFKGDKSYYYLYEVDENKKIFKLVNSIEVEYSGIVSSVQTLNNGNVLIDSGTAGVFNEFDNNNKLIRKFTLKLNDMYVYRVLKYDYKGFWFN